MTRFELTPLAKSDLPPRLLLGVWCATNHLSLAQLATQLGYQPRQLSRFWRHRTDKNAKAIENHTGLSLPPEAWLRKPAWLDDSASVPLVSTVIRPLVPVMNLEDLLAAENVYLELHRIPHADFARRLGASADSLWKTLRGDPLYPFRPAELERFLELLGFPGFPVQLNLFPRA